MPPHSALHTLKSTHAYYDDLHRFVRSTRMSLETVRAAPARQATQASALRRVSGRFPTTYSVPIAEQNLRLVLLLRRGALANRRERFVPVDLQLLLDRLPKWDG